MVSYPIKGQVYHDSQACGALSSENPYGLIKFTPEWWVLSISKVGFFNMHILAFLCDARAIAFNVCISLARIEVRIPT